MAKSRLFKHLLNALALVVIIGCTPQLKAPWESGEIILLSKGDKVSSPVGVAFDGISFGVTKLSSLSSKSQAFSFDANSTLLIETQKNLFLSENTSTTYSGFSLDDSNIKQSFVDDRVDPSVIYALTDDGLYVSADRSDAPPFTQYLNNVNLSTGSLSENSLFIGSDTGLYVGSTASSLTAPHANLPTQIINHILVNTLTAPDQVLVSTNDGLYISNDDGTTFTRHSDIPVENILSSVSDLSTTYLTAGTSGVFLSTDTGTSFNLIGAGTIAQTNTVQDMVLGPNGEIYIGTDNGLAYSLDGGVTFTELSSTSSNLIGDDIRDLEVDSLGNLYVATDKGLSILRPGELLFINETTEDGLSDNSINAIEIIEDELGNPSIYLSTDLGVNQLINPMPNTPTGLTAVALNSSSAKLDWISGGGSTGGFKLLYKLGTSTPTDCNDATATSVDVGNVNTYTLTPLTHLSTYSLKVCPYNELKVVDHAKSMEVQVDIPEDIAPLSALNLDFKDTSNLHISWSSTGGTTDGWILAFNTTNTPPLDCTSGTNYTLGQTSLILSGLPSLTPHSFRLCAENTTGFLNTGTTLSTSTDELAPPTPTLNTMTSVTQNTTVANYTSGGGTTDNVKMIYKIGLVAPLNCLDGTISSPGTTGSISVTGLTSNTDYTFVACAYNITSNTSTVSNSLSIKTNNFAPTDITLANSSIIENVSIGTLVGTLTESDADPNETYTFNLVAGVGSTDNASFSVSGNTLLSAAVFDFESKNLYSIRLDVTDSNGNSFEKAMTITILNDNDLPPQLVTPTASIAATEGIAITAEDINDLSGGDTDIEGDQIFYSCFYDMSIDGTVANTTPCSSLGIDLTNATNTNGLVGWTPSFTTSGSYEFKMIGDDTVFNDFKIFEINVANANAPPHDIILSSYSITENIAAGFSFASITALDVDPADTVFTFSLLSGTGDTNNSDFDIIGSDNLENTVMFDADVTPTKSIRMRAVEPGGLTYDEIITINITNINDNTPTIATQLSQTVPEDIQLQVDINTIQGTDLDIDEDTLFYSCFYDQIVDGSVSEVSACSTLGVTINNGVTTDGLFYWTPTYFQEGEYEFKIKAFDGIYTDNEIFSTTVTHVNAPPTDISMTSSSVLENQAINTVVGQLTSTDADLLNLTDSFTYTLVSGTGDTDNGDFTINGDIIETLATFDRETKPTYSIRVQSEDAEGKSFAKAIAISIDNINEYPSITDFPASDPHTFTEGQTFTFNVNDATGGDTDIDGDALTYTCFSDTTHDGAVAEGGNVCSGIGVSLNASTGAFSWRPSYSQSGNYELKIIGTDPGGLKDEHIFKFIVLNGTQLYRCPNISNGSGPGGVCNSNCNGQTQTGSSCSYRTIGRTQCNGGNYTSGCTPL